MLTKLCFSITRSGYGMAMHSTEVRIGDNDLLARMAEMRTWLDARRLEPATFRYSIAGDGIIIRVAFPIADQAAAFAREFDGQVLR